MKLSEPNHTPYGSGLTLPNTSLCGGWWGKPSLARLSHAKSRSKGFTCISSFVDTNETFNLPPDLHDDTEIGLAPPPPGQKRSKEGLGKAFLAVVGPGKFHKSGLSFLPLVGTLTVRLDLVRSFFGVVFVHSYD